MSETNPTPDSPLPIPSTGTSPDVDLPPWLKESD